MKYRGVKIVRIKGTKVCNCWNHRGEKGLKAVEVTVGFAPIGMWYPYSIHECHKAIDRLILQVILTAKCSEKEAAKILNEC